jgi:MFS family permease
MLADIIPERDRARVFANRNIILSAATAVATFTASWWLDQAAHIRWAAFPTNYQIVYFFGAVGALMSVFYLFKVKAPPSKVIRRQKQFKIGKVTLPKVKAAFRQMRTGNREFVRLTLHTLIFNLGAWLVMPLYIIFFVRELNASDGWIGLNSTLANLGVIVGYLVWRRSIHRLGNYRALLISIPLSASYAFLVSFFPNLNAILVWGVLINLVNPGVNLSHTSILYELCPDERRASYMAIYSSIMNVGAFVGPMIGVALAEVLNIRLMLILGGIIRLAGALLFHFVPLQPTQTVQAEEK